MNESNAEIKKTSRWWAILSAELIITLLVLLASIWAFAFTVEMVFVSKASDLDNAVFDAVSKIVNPFLTRFMLSITFLGNHAFLIPANFLLLGFYWGRKNRKFSRRILVVALSSLSLKLLLKNSFQRLRPDIPLLEKVAGFSFPSGHALMSVTFYGLLIYIAWREVSDPVWKWVITVLLGLLIFLVSFSRIYLRVHYASDVIAGVALGIFWLFVSLWIIGKLEKKAAPKNT